MQQKSNHFNNKKNCRRSFLFILFYLFHFIYEKFFIYVHGWTSDFWPPPPAHRQNTAWWMFTDSRYCQDLPGNWKSHKKFMDSFHCRYQKSQTNITDTLSPRKLERWSQWKFHKNHFFNHSFFTSFSKILSFSFKNCIFQSIKAWIGQSANRAVKDWTDCP